MADLDSALGVARAMSEIGERLARLEAKVDALTERVADLARAIHGPNGSLRGRVHDLENAVTTLRLADETLSRIAADRKEQAASGLTKKQWWAALGMLALSAVGTVLTIVVLVTGGNTP